MSWNISIKYICILLILKTFITKVKNSYVLCDDDETACPSNYSCCKRSKGYICCYKTMICCKNGESCCQNNEFFSELKKNEEKPKIAFSLIEMKNQLENKNATNSFIASEDANNNVKDQKGLVEKIHEVLKKIKAIFINKNLRGQSLERLFNLVERIEEFIESVKNSFKDSTYFSSKIVRSNRNLFVEIEKIMNEFLIDYKGSENYQKLYEVLSNLIKYFN